MDTAHDRIELLENALGNADRVINLADRGLNDAVLVIDAAELLLGNADKAVDVVERGVEAGKQIVPKIAIGLAIVGVGVAVAVLIRRSRAARQAAQANIVEQPEEAVDQVEAQEFEQDSREPDSQGPS